MECVVKAMEVLRMDNGRADKSEVGAFGERARVRSTSRSARQEGTLDTLVRVPIGTTEVGVAMSRITTYYYLLRLRHRVCTYNIDCIE